jgi:calcium/calmodulin-dependent protein kinase I
MGNSSSRRSGYNFKRKKTATIGGDCGTDQTDEQIIKFEEQFEVSDTVLGRGADAIVYEAFDHVSRTKVAIKVVDLLAANTGDRGSILRARFQRETSIMGTLQHRNLVKMLDYHETVGKLAVLMEYVEGGSLGERITDVHGVGESNAKTIMVGLAEAVRYLHSNGVVHRDIKAENILVCSADSFNFGVKLCDFGFASYCEGETLTELLGTLDYLAPEIIRKRPYGKPVDMWALGVVMYILLSGRFPFFSSDRRALCFLILKGEYALENDPRWDGVSEQARDLLKHLLVLDPSQRYTITDVLSHPWILSHVDSPLL